VLHVTLAIYKIHVFGEVSFNFHHTAILCLGSAKLATLNLRPLTSPVSTVSTLCSTPPRLWGGGELLRSPRTFSGWLRCSSVFIYAAFAPRKTRSNKEYSPYSWAPDIVLQDVETPALFSAALIIQNASLDNSADDPVDSIRPVSERALLQPQPSRPSLIPLSNLLIQPAAPRHSCTPLRPQQLEGLSAREKEKLRKKEAYRQKRSQSRASEAAAGNSTLKGYVQRRMAQAVVLVVQSTMPARKNSWVGLHPQSQESAPELPYLSPRIISSGNVFRLSGLELVKWDGRFASPAVTHRLLLTFS